MSNSTISIGNNSQLFCKFTFPKVDLCSLALNFASALLFNLMIFFILGEVIFAIFCHLTGFLVGNL